MYLPVDLRRAECSPQPAFGITYDDLREAVYEILEPRLREQGVTDETLESWEMLAIGCGLRWSPLREIGGFAFLAGGKKVLSTSGAKIGKDVLITQIRCAPNEPGDDTPSWAQQLREELPEGIEITEMESR